MDSFFLARLPFVLYTGDNKQFLVISLKEDCISNTIKKQMENPEIENIMLKKDFGQSTQLDKASFVTPNYHATSERQDADH